MENTCCDMPDSKEAILAFDTLYTTNHMKILKVIFPHINYKLRNKLAVYIKWQEFLFSLRFMEPVSSFLPPDVTDRQENNSPAQLLSLLLPYCSEEEKLMLLRIQETFGLMENLKHMKEYLPLMQNLMAGAGDKDFNPMDILGSLLSEEQREMFSMFMDS